MAARIKGVAKLILPAGTAKMSPSVGQALGPLALPAIEVIRSFNSRTEHLKPDTPIPVTITAFQDRTFDFVTRTPSTSWFIKKAAGIEKGAASPGNEVIARITVKHVYEIAKIKQTDAHLAHIPLKSLTKTVMASCRSMGVEVVNKL